MANYKDEPVAAVADNELRIYGAENEKTGVRKLESVKKFPHRGAALLAAVEFDDATKNQGKPRGRA